MLPDYTSLTQILEKFSNYVFAAVTLKLDLSNWDGTIVDDENITEPPVLSSLPPATVNKVVKLIKQSAPK